MFLPWISQVLGNLMGSIHDIWSYDLGNIVQFSYDGVVVEVEVKFGGILECMQMQGCLCWYGLGMICLYSYIFYDRVNECPLGNLISTVGVLVYIYTYVVGRVSLVFYVKS